MGEKRGGQVGEQVGGVQLGLGSMEGEWGGWLHGMAAGTRRKHCFVLGGSAAAAEAEAMQAGLQHHQVQWQCSNLREMGGRGRVGGWCTV